MENLPEALKLLAVGMLTVFAILLIVIYLGKFLIAIVNKIAPEESQKKSPTPSVTAVDANINEAVKQLTAGKGHVMNIKKL